MELHGAPAPVLLTGVGRAGQVGAAVARAFASAGATTLLVAHSVKDAEARAAELSGIAPAVPFAADLTNETDVAALRDRVRARGIDRLGALVNVAGGFDLSGPLDQSDPVGWDRQFAINLSTAYLATRAFLPLIRAGRGAIVYFGSEAALPGARTGKIAGYAAAKTAVLALMQSVAQEEAARGVRANAVAPGTIRTAANVAAMGEQAAQGFVDPADVAATVLFLCSDAARAVTGQVFRLS